MQTRLLVEKFLPPNMPFSALHCAEVFGQVRLHYFFLLNPKVYQLRNKVERKQMDNMVIWGYDYRQLVITVGAPILDLGTRTCVVKNLPTPLPQMAEIQF